MYVKSYMAMLWQIENLLEVQLLDIHINNKFIHY